MNSIPNPVALSKSTAQEIAARLAEKSQDVLIHLLPNGTLKGREWCVGSVGGEPGQSLKVNLDKSCWQDFATGQKGDLLELWAQVRCGGDTRSAMREAREWLGMPSAPRNNVRPLGRPSAKWTYCDVDGNPWIEIHRHDLPGNKKFFRQFDIREQKWIKKDGHQLPSPRPLYNLQAIVTPDDESDFILLVEGEKCADALINLGFVATTTIGGSQSAHKTDFSPLEGRTVIIWRDNDEAGQKYAQEAGKALLQAKALPRTLPVPEDKPEGWDVADAIAEGWSKEDVTDLAAQSVEFEPKRILKAVSFATLATMHIPPREMVLGPILPTQGLSMLYAPRGIGKTFVSLGIAYAVASGGQFLRWQAPKARRVLFVDGEMPAVVLQERISGMLLNNTAQLTDADYLKIITPDLQETGSPDLSTREGQAALEEHLDDVELIVLDNLSTLCRTGAENEGESWLPIQEWLLSLRRRGMSVLMIHHSGKGGQQRGTSRREDILDTVISLKRPRDYEPEQGARFEVHYEKARTFHGADAEAFEAHLSTTWGQLAWTVKSLGDVLTEQIVQLKKEGLSDREIAAELGISKSNVNRRLKAAQQQGVF